MKGYERDRVVEMAIALIRETSSRALDGLTHGEKIRVLAAVHDAEMRTVANEIVTQERSRRKSR